MHYAEASAYQEEPLFRDDSLRSFVLNSERWSSNGDRLTTSWLPLHELTAHIVRELNVFSVAGW